MIEDSDNRLIEEIENSNTIFHYTTAKVALEHILPFGKLRLSLLENTNDPLEYKYLYINVIGSFEFPHQGSLEPKLVSDVTQKINEIRRKECQMVSFSKNRENKINGTDFTHSLFRNDHLGYALSRMWSQYGDNHFGVALAFDSQKLLGLIKAEEANYKYFKSKMMGYEPIDNNNRSFINCSKIAAKGVEEYCDCFIREFEDELFFTKNSDYRDEIEFRIIIRPIIKEHVLVNIKGALIAIIIGDRFPDGLLPSLAFLSSQLKVPCRRIWFHNGDKILVNCSPLSSELYDNWNGFRIHDPK